MVRLEVSRNDVRRSSFARYRGAELQNFRLFFNIIAIEAMSSEDGIHDGYTGTMQAEMLKKQHVKSSGN